MVKIDALPLLNRLFAIEYRSLAMYLSDACPWTRNGDEKAAAALANILADQRAMAVRIAELVDSRGANVSYGSFPMEYTDLNLLSLDFLLREMVAGQHRDIAEIEHIVAALAGDAEARDLASEILGAERAHLEMLEELVNQPA